MTEQETEQPDEPIVVPYESIGEAPVDTVTEEDDQGDAGPQGINDK